MATAPNMYTTGAGNIGNSFVTYPMVTCNHPEVDHNALIVQAVSRLRVEVEASYLDRHNEPIAVKNFPGGVNGKLKADTRRALLHRLDEIVGEIVAERASS